MKTRTLSRGTLISACFLILTALTPAVMADGLAQITRAFSGIWDQPHHQSQGFILEITEDGEGQKIGVAYWFTYGDDLFSSWFLAVGPVEGDQINMTLYEASGIAFLGGSLEGDPNVEEIGTLVMTFSNCQHGNASWETGDHPLGSGDVEIKRLTKIYRMECSGGISDDTPSDAKPNRLKAYLVPARDDVLGEGEALFWERTDRSDFKVEVEGVPDETYTLEVCDEVRGEIVVLAGEGEIKFRSPGIDGMPLLDFDPRDCPIEVLDGLGVALTTGDQVLSVNPVDPDDDEQETEMEIEVELTNTGVLGGAEGEAEYEAEGDSRSFEVEVEEVGPGLYPVHVGGLERGVIEVTEDEGKLRWSDPQEGDDLLLDFEVLGQVIEVYFDGLVILETLFPDA